MTHSKKFLNDNPNEFGSICWSVEDMKHWRGKKKGEIKTACQSSEVKLTDCSRHITLDFSYHNKEQYEERLSKMHLLISELQMVEKLLTNSFVPADPDEKVDEDGELIEELEDVITG